MSGQKRTGVRIGPNPSLPMAHQVFPVVFQEALLDAQYWASCVNCEWWSEVGVPTGQCLKWKVVPPPKVIVVGCPEWTGVIPF